MAHLRISTEGISTLGDDLGFIADYLEVRAHYTRSGDGDTYGFPSATGWGALDHLLGDYERVRIAACKELRNLRRLAKDAGPCYLEAEDIADPRQRRVR